MLKLFVNNYHVKGVLFIMELLEEVEIKKILKYGLLLEALMNQLNTYLKPSI